MIGIKEVEVFNFMGAIRGLRNPLESWLRSDSIKNSDGTVTIGENDLELMKRLFKAGRDHRKFTRQILVSMDITAPDYFFREFDTYKIGTVANSTSQMHKIMSKPFDESMFSCETLKGYKKEIEQFIPEIDEDEEEWKTYPENDLYMISTFGRIKRLEYKTTHNRIHKERIMPYSLTSDSYLKANLNYNGVRKDIRVHQLVAQTFIPNPDNKPFVNHIDGNKLNNHVDNLEWCTAQENIIHSVKNNLQPVALNTYLGKFTEKEREEIKRKFEDGKTKRELAIEYNVSHTCICDIINNKYLYKKHTNEYQEFKNTLREMNRLREEWLRTKNPEIWKQVVQMCPQSWNYTRHLTLNYEVLYNMYNSRKNHKLTEWREFCKFIKENMPYFKEIGSIEEE